MDAIAIASAAPLEALPPELADLDAGKQIVLIAEDDERAMPIIAAMRRAGRDVSFVRLAEMARGLPPVAPVAPEEHPRTKQILSLHRRLSDQQRELAAYEEELQAGAAGLAVELDRLDNEHDASVDLCVTKTVAAADVQKAVDLANLAHADAVDERRKEIARLQAEISELDVRHAAVVDGLRTAKADADSAAAAERANERALGAALDAARAEFDARLNTSRRRRLAEKVEDAKAHIARIFERHPDAQEAWVRDLLVRQELERAGVPARVRACAELLSSGLLMAKFKERFEALRNAAGVVSQPDCLRMTLDLLREHGADPDDAQVDVIFKKGTGVSIVVRGASPAARARAYQALLKKPEGAPPA